MDALGDGIQALLDKARRATFSGGFSDDPEIPLLYRSATARSSGFASPGYGPATPYHTPPSPDFAGGASPAYSYAESDNWHGGEPYMEPDPELAYSPGPEPYVPYD